MFIEKGDFTLYPKTVNLLLHYYLKTNETLKISKEYELLKDLIYSKDKSNSIIAHEIILKILKNED